MLQQPKGDSGLRINNGGREPTKTKELSCGEICRFAVAEVEGNAVDTVIVENNEIVVERGRRV